MSPWALETWMCKYMNGDSNAAVLLVPRLGRRLTGLCRGREACSCFARWHGVRVFGCAGPSQPRADLPEGLVARGG
jgi:hypothetical protein